MSFRQWRVAVIVMLSTIILLRGGGALHISIADFVFAEGGGVEDAKFSQTSFKD